jgi:mRNA interferase YafQ
VNLVYTGRFKKDFKLAIKRNKDENKLWNVVEKLLKNQPLPAKCKDHPLSGKWNTKRDCHIEPDWILIYCIRNDDLILERIGSHSDLFR